MPSTGALVFTEAFVALNPLELLVVRAVDRTLVGTLRRTREFAPEDYDRRRNMVGDLRVSVTPIALTEGSNPLKRPRVPQQTQSSH